MRMFRAVPRTSSRNIALPISPSLKAQLDAYAKAHDLTQAEAVREVMSLGFSASPNEEVIRTAAQRAFDRTRFWSIRKTADFFRDAAAELERQAGTRTLEAT